MSDSWCLLPRDLTPPLVREVAPFTVVLWSREETVVDATCNIEDAEMALQEAVLKGSISQQSADELRKEFSDLIERGFPRSMDEVIERLSARASDGTDDKLRCKLVEWDGGLHGYCVHVSDDARRSYITYPSRNKLLTELQELVTAGEITVQNACNILAQAEALPFDPSPLLNYVASADRQWYIVGRGMSRGASPLEQLAYPSIVELSISNRPTIVLHTIEALQKAWVKGVQNMELTLEEGVQMASWAADHGLRTDNVAAIRDVVSHATEESTKDDMFRFQLAPRIGEYFHGCIVHVKSGERAWSAEYAGCDQLLTDLIAWVAKRQITLQNACNLLKQAVDAKIALEIPERPFRLGRPELNERAPTPASDS